MSAAPVPNAMERLSEERLRALAQDPRNVVYRYEADAAAQPALSARETFDLLNCVLRAYGRARIAHPALDDDECRRLIARGDRKLDGFRLSRPKVFELATSRETPRRGVDHLMLSVALVQKQRDGYERARDVYQDTLYRDYADKAARPDAPEWQAPTPDELARVDVTFDDVMRLVESGLRDDPAGSN